MPSNQSIQMGSDSPMSPDSQLGSQKVSQEETIHTSLMERALELARYAYDQGEVPIGAIVVSAENQIIGEGYNQKETLNDPTLHAEIIAIKEAVNKTGNWRLNGCTLYTTLEPCPMCAGALVQARISKVVMATLDAKGGGVISKFQIGQNEALNHKFEIDVGCCEEKSSSLLKKFFSELRLK